MIRNTLEAWGWPARTLHWAIALLVLFTFVFGLWMTEVPARIDRPYYFAIHASVGMTLLVLLAARLLWVLANPAPRLPDGTPPWQQTAARLTHIALYFFAFATGGLGWLLMGTDEQAPAPKAFGVLPMAAPLKLGPAYEDFLEEAHEFAAYALIAAISLHVAAALWHHFVLRDEVLQRMWRGRTQPTA